MNREAVIGGGTTCPDGLPHQGGGQRPDQCWRCDSMLKPIERREGASRLVGRPLDENGTIELAVERCSRFRIIREHSPEGIRIESDPLGQPIEKLFRKAQDILGWGCPVGCRCVDCASRSAATDCVGRQA